MEVTAFWLVIAGQFVFVVLVADVVVPNAPRGMCTFFKTMFGAAFYLSLAWMVFLVMEITR